jgi:hypothetical protein
MARPESRFTFVLVSAFGSESEEIPGHDLSHFLSLLTQQSLSHRWILDAQTNDERTFPDSAYYLLRTLPGLLIESAGKSFVANCL